jgi:hypothetical protein
VLPAAVAVSSWFSSGLSSVSWATCTQPTKAQQPVLLQAATSRAIAAPSTQHPAVVRCTKLPSHALTQNLTCCFRHQEMIQGCAGAHSAACTHHGPTHRLSNLCCCTLQPPEPSHPPVHSTQPLSSAPGSHPLHHRTQTLPYPPSANEAPSGPSAAQPQYQ